LLLSKRINFAFRVLVCLRGYLRTATADGTHLRGKGWYLMVTEQVDVSLFELVDRFLTVNIELFLLLENVALAILV